MATKQNPGRFDCLANAEPDEPYFVLLARDEDGERALFHWILCRLERIRDGVKPMADLPQVKEALDCLYDMRRWREAHTRTGAPPSLLELPGPADRAWINGVLNNLTGKTKVGERDDAAADQGWRRPTE